MSSYQLYTDNELVLLLRKDDHTAFTEIYVRYSGALYNNAYKLLRDRDEVKDIVQEIFTSLWNRRSDFTINTSLAGYLYITVRNRVLKVISHQQIKSNYFSLLQTSIEETSAVTDYAIREKQLAEIIESEINELPSKMRQILNLSRKSHLSHKQIAHELDLSESTVKKQVNNALKILRIKLGALFLFILIIIIFNNCIQNKFYFFHFHLRPGHFSKVFKVNKGNYTLLDHGKRENKRNAWQISDRTMH